MEQKIIKTRTNDPRLRILKRTPGIEDIEIKGSQLPTHEQVLLSYQAQIDQQNHGSRCQRTIIKAIIQNVKTIYVKANIPSKDESGMSRDIQALVKEYQKVNKNNNHSSISKFHSQLEETMPFWPRKTLEDMEKKLASHLTTDRDKKTLKNDIAFLKSMMYDRKAATFGAKDTLHAKKISNQMEREEMRKRSQGKCNEQQSSCKLATIQSSDEEEATDDQQLFTPPPAKRSHKRVVKTGTTLELTPDFLQSPVLQQRAQRCGITPTALAATMEALIESQGGDTSTVNLSYSQANRCSIQAAYLISANIKDNWTPPSKCVIHWDGKLMKTLDESGIEDRLPILISGNLTTFGTD